MRLDEGQQSFEQYLWFSPGPRLRDTNMSGGVPKSGTEALLKRSRKIHRVTAGFTQRRDRIAVSHTQRFVDLVFRPSALLSKPKRGTLR